MVHSLSYTITRRYSLHRFSGGDCVRSYDRLFPGDHTGVDVADESVSLLEESVVVRHECRGVVSRRVDEGNFHGSILGPSAPEFRLGVR